MATAQVAQVKAPLPFRPPPGQTRWLSWYLPSCTGTACPVPTPHVQGGDSPKPDRGLPVGKDCSPPLYSHCWLSAHRWAKGCVTELPTYR